MGHRANILAEFELALLFLIGSQQAKINPLDFDIALGKFGQVGHDVKHKLFLGSRFEDPISEAYFVQTGRKQTGGIYFG